MDTLKIKASDLKIGDRVGVAPAPGLRPIDPAPQDFLPVTMLHYARGIDEVHFNLTDDPDPQNYFIVPGDRTLTVQRLALLPKA